MDGFKAYKLSLTLDCVCIIIAAIILYCANNALLPLWGLIAGALLALAFLVVAIMLLMVARRDFKQQAKAEQDRLENEISNSSDNKQ